MPGKELKNIKVKGGIMEKKLSTQNELESDIKYSIYNSRVRFKLERYIKLKLRTNLYRRFCVND